ncbi:MAG: NUDIX pyrophosphatase [Deltaproteobacteria bacterium]|nr:NUDIX pyrophosphatase [Deltaproteobacteria bacterium]PNV85196.1 MAG: NUDIX pyrophosphatase [Desulfobacteraceae bacterium]MDH3801280.1 NUDIX pyrophosphatase [Deltaproteobacteria bacterium]MDH3849590.1 NUDIX pyrophosphatase [Deltaproteobacteria bacterium]MDH3897146.1 NUDIX pyrophosphatase [Deltaproteobacteria bacterium]
MGEFQDVVTVFLTHRSKILVLKRSREVGTYKGHWAGVSGYLESEDPLKQAYSEMAEEVGLSEQDVTLVKAGKPLEIVDDAQDRAWRVHPFLFSVHEPDKIRLDWENIEMRWILPEEIDQLKTVPALKETLERVIGDG